MKLITLLILMLLSLSALLATIDELYSFNVTTTHRQDT